MVIFDKKLIRYNEILYAKNKMNFDNRKMTNQPPPSLNWTSTLHI